MTKLILYFLAALAVGGLLVFIIGWMFTPLDIFSRGNVQEQWRFAYDMEEDLKSAARQVCNARVALENANTDWEKQQRQSQLTGLENNYARIASDYNAQMRDKFRAGLVKPSDVRRRAPSLNEMIDELRYSEDITCPE